MMLESIKIIITLLFLIAGSYFDIKNRRNVPDQLAYAFLIVAFAFALYEFNIITFAIAIIVLLFSYLLYRLGQMGLGEVFYFTSLSLLFPFPPSFTHINLPIPFIIPILVYAVIIAGYYMIFYIIYKCFKKKKQCFKINKWEQYAYLLMPIIFIIIPFIFPKVFYLGNIMAFYMISLILLIIMSFLGAFKENIGSLLVGEISLEKAEDEIIYLEKHKELQHLFKISPLITKQKIKKLKDMGYKKIFIYNDLLPFLPFLTLGFLSALFLTNLLII